MKKKSLFLISLLASAQFFGSASAQAAATYTLQITVNEVATVGNVARFNGATVKEVCGAPNYLYLTPSFDEYAAKISSATRVRVKNESSKIIGTGGLSSILWITKYSSGNLIQGSCKFVGKVKVKSAQFYSIELVGLGSYDFSATELKAKKWKVNIDF
jgi:hypothetical protein